MTGSVGDAEDIVQDALSSALNRGLLLEASRRGAGRSS